MRQMNGTIARSSVEMCAIDRKHLPGLKLLWQAPTVAVRECFGQEHSRREMLRGVCKGYTAFLNPNSFLHPEKILCRFALLGILNGRRASSSSTSTCVLPGGASCPS